MSAKELNIGDYVRTKDGRIFRWNKLCTTSIEDYMEHTRKILYIEDEIKSSPNIIDLIEVGDYVNEYKVYYCYCADEDSTGLFIDTEKGREWLDKSSQIKSIVTKEQFESMEYKIGEV